MNSEKQASSENLADKVFEYMVRNLEGRGTPDNIREKSGLFSKDNDAIGWFRRMQSRFNCIERDGAVELVLVYHPEVSYCLRYLTYESCQDIECKYFHVCSNMLAGNCPDVEKCKFSHNLRDRRNVQFANFLGSDMVFTSNEICTILKAHYPHVCLSWKKNGSCTDRTCIGLHLCSKYILGKCQNDTSCEFIHDRFSKHNGPIVKSYRLDKCNEYYFKARVYITAKPKDIIRKSMIMPYFGKIRHETDSDDDLGICEADLMNECVVQPCKYLHCNRQLPYLWQIKRKESWITLDGTKEVEKDFCELQNHSKISLMITKVEYLVVVHFESLRADVTNLEENTDEQVEVRRLSTSSYRKIGRNPAELFKTQWIWYWKDDTKAWQRFTPDFLQQTLETEYLAKQCCYGYCGDNYQVKYTIDFNAMSLTRHYDGLITEISRRPVYVSAEDVKARQHPGRLPPMLEIETTIPILRVPWDIAYPFEFVRLSESTIDFMKVSECFYKTYDQQTLIIDKIFQLRKQKRRTEFKNGKQTMEEKFCKSLGHIVPLGIRYFFYGIDNEGCLMRICLENIGNNALDKNASKYGDGTLIARDTNYCQSYTKLPMRKMLLVKVLVGQYTKGDK